MIYVIKKETRTLGNDRTVITRQRLLGYTNSLQTAEEIVKKLNKGKDWTIMTYNFGNSYSIVQLNEIITKLGG